MEHKEISRSAYEAVEHFDFGGELLGMEPYGSGHINDTYCVRCALKDGKEKRYILQRMNTEVFKKPEELMSNVAGVTEFLRKKIIEQGGDPERETLNILRTKSGDSYCVTEDGGCWRVYLFIEDSFGYDLAETAEDFYQSALAFGHFQALLADYPAETLYETIPNFHNTISRFADFRRAVEADVCGRAAAVQAEIQFVLDREADAHVMCDLQAAGELPLRVTHNDTKLNNVLIDKKTGKGLCVIDLDTVMPGLAANDFGDSIRFGASTALEDEKDLSKVWCDMALFEIYTRGFLESCGAQLTAREIETLPMGAKLMTFECGMRFLADYLSGDTYFKTAYETHNLDRCRTQFKLVADMETKWDEMQAIVKRVWAEVQAR